MVEAVSVVVRVDSERPATGLPCYGTIEVGECTLFHCTAGKDRTGIVSMALLKSYGVADEEIIRDYMGTNRNAFWPTIKKCLGVLMLTHNWELVKTCYTSFMAQRELIETAIKYY